jgi:TonB family protein
MLILILTLAGATADKPIAEQIAKWCSDGTISPKDARCPPQQAVPHPQPVYSLPLPMPDKRQPTKPKNNPGSWVVTNDYPLASLRNEDEGVTGFRVTVNVTGRVSACAVTQSSGFPLLDEATCKHVSDRAEFYPARDGSGKTMIGSYANRVRWQIPTGPSYAYQVGAMVFGARPQFGSYLEIDDGEYPRVALEEGMQGITEVLLTISAKGAVTDCVIENSSGHALLDDKSCEIARRWRFVMPRNGKDKAISSKTRHLFKWILPEARIANQQTSTDPKKP